MASSHPRRLRAMLGLAVLLAHALLFGGLARWAPSRSGAPDVAAAPLILWLPSPPVAVSPLAMAAARPRPAPAALPATPRLPLARSVDAPHQAPQPSASTDAAPTQLLPLPQRTTPAPDPATALAAVASAARAASQAPAGTLNLALPAAGGGRPPPAAWATQDERLHTRPNREARLAQALGTDTRLQESLRGEVRRFQQGRDCVDAAPAREALLNPFNQSVSATPRQIRPC